jgi:hypothetical protein
MHVALYLPIRDQLLKKLESITMHQIICHIQATPKVWCKAYIDMLGNYMKGKKLALIQNLVGKKERFFVVGFWLWHW